jgi:hypothetical protein
MTFGDQFDGAGRSIERKGWAAEMLADKPVVTLMPTIVSTVNHRVLFIITIAARAQSANLIVSEQ